MKRALIIAGLLWLIGIVPADAQSADKSIPVTGTGPGNYDFTDGAIASGQTLVWDNATNADHTASGPWGTIPIPAGGRSQVITITGEPRTINYSCTIHANMSGQLQVTAAQPTTAPPVTATPMQPPPTTAKPTATTRTGTATTRRTPSASIDTGSTTIPPAGDFSVLAPTTTEPATTSSSASLAIKEDDEGGGGTSGGTIAALAIGLAAVLGGGAYALARLRGQSP